MGMVMDFHPGGDLLSLLNRRHMTEEDARFYLARNHCRFACASFYGLRTHDIKPENVLLDRLGQVKWDREGPRTNGNLYTVSR